ncbi:MAG: hypothetical protein KKB20_10960 [Proteobacteria bacterium]|nr:hypothetical protein [Pseudomonadota bacterium]
MPVNDLEFHVAGPRAEENARELSALLESLFGRPAQTLRAGESGRPAERFDANTMAVAALIVAIPSGILATLQLADRCELKEKIQRLIDWAKTRRREDERHLIAMVAAKSEVQPLDRADAVRTVDALAVSAKAKKEAD